MLVTAIANNAVRSAISATAGLLDSFSSQLNVSGHIPTYYRDASCTVDHKWACTVVHEVCD